MSYIEIAEHYRTCLEIYGDTHKGLDWPNSEDMYKRYQIMFELFNQQTNNEEISLLDFGCGTSGFYKYILDKKVSNLKYSGLDISINSIDISKQKFPENHYFCCDILKDDVCTPIFDYTILNGVFTVKKSLAFDEMFDFLKSILIRVAKITKFGFAFNVMSKQVDWEREDLFHLPLDLISSFLCKNISRNYVIRNDYGLYEYTVYVYI